MKKAKNGMTIISLMSAVTIILILLATVTVSGIDTAHNAKKIAFGSEIKMIQGAVDSYYTKNNAIFPVKDNAYNLDISSASSKNIKIFQDNEGEGKTSFIVYEIDCNLININNLIYGNKKEENDMYVLSRNSGKVYYLKGIKIGNETYYTVTDDIENLLSYNNEKNTVNSPVIKFEPSTTDWTNDDITLKITIPSTCTLNSVKFEGEEKTLTNSEIEIEKNGTLIVKYTESINQTEIKEAKYIVSNIDKVAPKLDIDTDELVEISSEQDLGYIKIKEKSDELSGIKNLKYEYGDVTDIATTYFKTSGKDIKEDIIFFRELTEPITIYVEDNAGNVLVKKITPQGDSID